MRLSSDHDSLHFLRHRFMTSQTNKRENTPRLELQVLLVNLVTRSFVRA